MTQPDAVPPAARGGPFDPDAGDAYARWRDARLAGHPRRLEDLAVEVADPLDLTETERAALRERVRRANMALYVPAGDGARREGEADGRRAVRAVARQLGLSELDPNMAADDDGVTPLHVAEGSPDATTGGGRVRYIPYTNRPIRWHTDGYYNAHDRQVRGLLLHCARPAARGGENRLLDHEVAYILLREADPAHVRALMRPDAMTVPANALHGEEIRPARTGPVFRVMPDGRLHMRYTRRSRSIEWADDPALRAALAYLEDSILDADGPFVFCHHMAAGEGLVSNNVLHDRAGFDDPPGPGAGRLVYRARYYDRIAET